MKLQDVYSRVSMPSWWERNASGVRPREALRPYAVFALDRWKGIPNVPPVRTLTPTRSVQLAGIGVSLMLLFGLMFIAGLVAALRVSDHAVLYGGATVLAGIAAVFGCVLYVRHSAAATQFRILLAKAKLAETRYGQTIISDADLKSLSEMVRDEEGKLTYCAAMIAGEITESRAWTHPNVEQFHQKIDLFDQISGLAAHARDIHQLRTSPAAGEEHLQRKKVVDDRMQVLLQHLTEFADYRDTVRSFDALLGSTRDTNDYLRRELTRASEELSTKTVAALDFLNYKDAR